MKLNKRTISQCILMIAFLGSVFGCSMLMTKEICPNARTAYERKAWAYKTCSEDPGCLITPADIEAVDLARSRVQAACNAGVDKRAE